MKKRKATTGEKLAASPPCNAHLYVNERKYLAKRIDAALRRAVREAFVEGWHASHYANSGKDSLSFDCSDRLKKKYGVKNIGVPKP